MAPCEIIGLGTLEGAQIQMLLDNGGPDNLGRLA
jgi:hypothetical protein